MTMHFCARCSGPGSLVLVALALALHCPPRARAAPQPARCTSSECPCFSLCDTASASAFLDNMPTMLNTSDSPWFDYLEFVYQSQVQLPFNLSSLRLLYSGYDAFRAKGNASSFPGTTCNNKHAPSCSSPHCTSFCARWLTADTRTSAAIVWLRRERPTRVIFNDKDELEHILLWVITDSKNSSPIHVHSTVQVDSHEWLEVTRTPKRGEGKTGYGTRLTAFSQCTILARHASACHPGQGGSTQLCIFLLAHVRQPCALPFTTHAAGIWFRPAPGSGIWMNSGRTKACYVKASCAWELVSEWAAAFPRWAPSELTGMGRWDGDVSRAFMIRARSLIQTAVMARNRAHGGNSTASFNWHPDATVAYIAYELGYDTVQIGRADLKKQIPEIICSSIECNLRPNCCTDCDAYERAMRCGLTVGVCPPTRVGLRAGMANLPCGCVENTAVKHPVLNCLASSAHLKRG